LKKFVYLLLIVVAAAYYYPAKPSSALYQIQSRVKSVGKTKADYEKELYYKKEELKAYEKAIVDVTNEIESMYANAPICPTTGQKAITTITKDPRDEMEARCDVLRKEIQELEAKI